MVFRGATSLRGALEGVGPKKSSRIAILWVIYRIQSEIILETLTKIFEMFRHIWPAMSETLIF